MAVSLKHSKTAIGDDNPDRQVSVSHWNAEHTLTGTANTVLGFDTNGNATETAIVGSYAASVATRAALAALSSSQAAVNLRESGRDGLFVWDSSDLSAYVTADTQQGLYVAPASDTTGASGAWVRKFSGPASFLWFGAVADCTVAGTGTSNTAAFNAARAALIAAGRGWLHIPKQAAAYRFATAPAQITEQIKITGDGWSESSSFSDVAQYNGTVLCFDADVPGLRFVGFSDNAANATANEFLSANGSLVRDLMLYSAGGTGTTAHGIATYVTVTLDNVRIQGFAGSGIYINGDAVGTSSNQYGNTAFTELLDVSSRSNKVHGFYVNGNNSSVIRFLGCDSAANGGGGYVQAAGFGNVHVNCHAASNNASFGTPVGFSAAQRTQCTTDWANLSDATVGSWYIPGASDATLLSGCYTESGAGAKSELAEIVVVAGGNVANAGNQKNSYSGTRIDGPRYYGLGEIYASSGGTVDIKRGSLDLSEDRGWVNPATARLLWNGVTGLTLGGSGTTYDVCIRRADGTAVVLLPHNSSTLSIANNVQVNNGYVFWNDVSAFIGPFGGPGNGQAFATAANGLSLAGRGSSYDVSLLNQSGSQALRVPVGTTNVEVVGTISGSNLNTSGFAKGIAANTVVANATASSADATAVALSASTILGRGASGNIAACTLATELAFSAAVLGVATNGITYAKFQQVAANSLVGNPTGSLANAQGITLAGNLGFSGTTLRTQTSTNNVLVGRTTAGAGQTEEITLAGGLAFSGTTLTAAGALTPTSIASTGAVTSSSATAGVGYATGAGGTVSQATSRTTGVTLNKACGAITLFSTTTAAGQHDRFTVTNSSVTATDVVNVSMKTATGKYIVSVLSTGAGTFDIGVYTPAAVGAAEAPVINFAVVKAVAA